MTRLITAGIILTVCTGVAQARQWADATGKFTVEADFVDFKDGKVQLKKADGSTITVPVERLSNADQKFVRETSTGRSKVAVAQQKEDEPVIPEEARRLNDEAKKCHEEGQLDKAIQLLTRVIQLAPRYADAYNNLAVVHSANGDRDLALSFAKKAISFAPKKGAYHRTLGLVYYSSGKLDEAITAFNKAISLGEAPAEMRSVLGNAYFRKACSTRRSINIKEALAVNPNLRGARNNLKAAEQAKAGER